MGALSGFLPFVKAARLLSPDGEISPAFKQLASQSQLTFGWLLLATALFAPLLTSWAQGAAARIAAASSRAFGCGLLALSALAACFVQAVVFDGIPHVTDAISHLFEAKILALGRLYAPLPECHEHFMQFNIHMTRSGRWFAPYPPGHALTLLPFVWLHALPWFGPVVAGLSALLFWRLCERFFGPATGRLTALLYAVSPLQLLLAGSFMSHSSFLLYALLVLHLATRALDVGRERQGRIAGRPAWFAAGAGLALGMTVLTRPQDAFLLGVCTALAILLTARAHLRLLWKLALPLLAGVLLPAAIQLGWNHVLYGHALAVGYGRTQIDTMTPILVSHLGLSKTFTLAVAVRQFVWSALRFDKALLGWTGAGLAMLLPLLRRRLDVRDALCLTCVAAVLAFYFFCDYYGFEFEARYFSAAVPCAVILVARGMLALRDALARWWDAAATTAVVLLAASLSLHALLFYWPRYVWPRYAHAYEEAAPDIRKAAVDAGLHRAIVLVRAEGDELFRYSSGFIWNDPLLRNDVIYARDLGAQNACLFDAFPDRRVYRFVPAERGMKPSFEEIGPAADRGAG